MFRPSGIKLPVGSTYTLGKVSEGVYIVTNAYEGRYEYFDDQPISDDGQVASVREPALQDDHDAPAPEAANRG
jgi:hypothetical protein